MSLASLAAKKVPLRELWELRNITPWDDINYRFTLEDLYKEDCLDEEKIFFVLDKNNLKTLLWPYIYNNVVKVKEIPPEVYDLLGIEISKKSYDDIPLVTDKIKYNMDVVKFFKKDLIKFIQDEGRLHKYYSGLYFAYGSGVSLYAFTGGYINWTQPYNKIDDVLQHLIIMMTNHGVIDRFYNPLPITTLNYQFTGSDFFNWENLSQYYITVCERVKNHPELELVDHLRVIGNYLHVFFNSYSQYGMVGKCYNKEDGIKLLRGLTYIQISIEGLFNS